MHRISKFRVKRIHTLFVDGLLLVFVCLFVVFLSFFLSFFFFGGGEGGGISTF